MLFLPIFPTVKYFCHQVGYGKCKMVNLIIQIVIERMVKYCLWNEH